MNNVAPEPAQLAASAVSPASTLKLAAAAVALPGRSRPVAGQVQAVRSAGQPLPPMSSCCCSRSPLSHRAARRRSRHIGPAIRAAVTVGSHGRRRRGRPVPRTERRPTTHRRRHDGRSAAASRPHQSDAAAGRAAALGLPDRRGERFVPGEAGRFDGGRRRLRRSRTGKSAGLAGRMTCTACRSAWADAANSQWRRTISERAKASASTSRAPTRSITPAML